jgi:hypothetical protein
MNSRLSCVASSLFLMVGMANTGKAKALWIRGRQDWTAMTVYFMRSILQHLVSGEPLGQAHWKDCQLLMPRQSLQNVSAYGMGFQGSVKMVNRDSL